MDTNWCLFYLFPPIISLIHSTPVKFQILNLISIVDRDNARQVSMFYLFHPLARLISYKRKDETKSFWIFFLFYYKRIQEQSNVGLLWLINDVISIVRIRYR